MCVLRLYWNIFVILWNDYGTSRGSLSDTQRENKRQSIPLFRSSTLWFSAKLTDSPSQAGKTVSPGTEKQIWKQFLSRQSFVVLQAHETYIINGSEYNPSNKIFKLSYLYFSNMWPFLRGHLPRRTTEFDENNRHQNIWLPSITKPADWNIQEWKHHTYV
jgi:hypothetical protein